MEPTFDSNGYPTDETLDALRYWPFEDRRGAFEYLKAAWKYQDRIGRANGGLIARHLLDSPHRITEEYELWHASTAGWSGNESLVDALNQNFTIWATTWQASVSGGHYWFRVPKGGAA